ncbi:sensor histidine kinase [Dermatophilus congolensis]|uniref:histidine kinase n=1 Tax=Dermatophilus congolensis TaxID=1863 RepID=A0A239VUZ6_9MICO|nr:HAMP domain-containing sensor histidine kinase [Dermatophilus congolensis]MBO3129954.1 HAMP domain-containing histidine kinase [Dermatophilus congolensis]MBO3131416.1 HAMP domain-containing histidine kinase [Dermatophilus congolensis]MBO3134428.1 HAMP domain-containing histidine kinase [Dermatophilus congolensis]MBO3136664.1 HAMP domain-containing histidine kinase [Dermatophilus congolensis]MBO3138908.1 HAMP domain-containing histidine kinase [Dermatophilus congolensis]
MSFAESSCRSRKGLPALRRLRSVRVYITVAVAVTSLLVSCVVSGVLAVRAADSATDAVRGQALARLIAASEGYALDGRLRLGASMDTDSAPEAVRSALADPNTKEKTTYYDGAHMWAATRLGPEVALVVQLDASTLAKQNDDRLQTLGIAAAASLVLSGLLGWIAGITISSRLRRAADGVVMIADGEDVSVSQKGHDEVAVLTAAIDDMAATLRGRVELERAFTSDVAHELRTPLTALVSAAELLPDDESSSIVRRQVTRLRRLVDDLLELSRLDRAAEPAVVERVDLAVTVQESLRRLGDVGAEVEFVVGATAEVMVDTRRLDRVMSNLVTNVVRHGGGQAVIQVDDNTLTVRDAGPGYPQDVIENGPRPFHAGTGSKGSGLGLTIAFKHAETMGAVVTLGRSEPDAEHPGLSGARTEVRFTRA